MACEREASAPPNFQGMLAGGASGELECVVGGVPAEGIRSRLG
ncbi:hypothetical protein ABZ511_26910 [Nocardia gamkensis]